MGNRSANSEQSEGQGRFPFSIPHFRESEFDMAILVRLAIVLLLTAFGLAVTGCGGGDYPDLGSVRGTVTAGGQGVAGVIVHFEPEEGRSAVAETDSNGDYELMYVHGVKGAKIGGNTVFIRSPDGKPSPVPIPEKYGADSEVKVDVQAGKNRFDFDLDAK